MLFTITVTETGNILSFDGDLALARTSAILFGTKGRLRIDPIDFPGLLEWGAGVESPEDGVSFSLSEAGCDMPDGAHVTEYSLYGLGNVRSAHPGGAAEALSINARKRDSFNLEINAIGGGSFRKLCILMGGTQVLEVSPDATLKLSTPVTFRQPIGGEPFMLAPNAVHSLGVNVLGFLDLIHYSLGLTAQFAMLGGNHQVMLMAQQGAIWASALAGTPNLINLSWSTAHNCYEVENLSGSDVTLVALVRGA